MMTLCPHQLGSGLGSKGIFGTRKREKNSIDIDNEGAALEIEIDDMFVAPTIIGLLCALEIFKSHGGRQSLKEKFFSQQQR